MELRGKVSVVTGAASGIGRALALRFAQEGAAGVVVGDLDGAGARRTAAEIRERAVGVSCDVRDRGQLAELIRAAERFGPIDLFAANAGVAVGSMLDATQDEWDVSMDVNVRSHVTAAELLLPGWLERGEGYFLSTASAAGLLSQIGLATYAVSKHAAVAFAEWLSISYGDQGVRVSCLCPMGVNTNLLNAGPDEIAAKVVATAGDIIEPADAAEAVVRGLRDERFLILTHPEVLTFMRRKVGDYDRWLAGMRRLQASITPPAAS